MTRQEYLKLRPVSNEYPMELFYNYFKDNNGKNDIHEFMQAFPMWANHMQITGSMLKISENVLNFYDTKFNIVVLLDKEGKQIKIL